MLGKDVVEKLRRSISKIQDASKGMDKIIQEAMENIDVIPIDIDFEKETVPVTSVDGSYQCLWKYPGLPIWLIHVRTAIVKRKYDPKKHRYDVIDDTAIDKFEVIDMIHGVKHVNGEDVEALGEMEMKMKDISAFCSLESLIEEERVVTEVASTVRGEMILYDGALSGYPYSDYNIQFNRSYEEGRRIIKGMIDACSKNGNTIVGISKDSGLKTISKKVTDEELLDAFGRRKSLKTGYYLIDEGMETKIGICFARLHPNAMKWFRIDYMIGEMMNLEETISTIARYSQVNLMPGTPIPPLQAHDLAVEARQIKDYIDSIVVSFLFDLGFSEEDVVQGLTDLNGKLLKGTHHDYLDNFTKVSRDKDVT